MNGQITIIGGTHSDGKNAEIWDATTQTWIINEMDENGFPKQYKNFLGSVLKKKTVLIEGRIKRFTNQKILIKNPIKLPIHHMQMNFIHSKVFIVEMTLTHGTAIITMTVLPVTSTDKDNHCRHPMDQWYLS